MTSLVFKIGKVFLTLLIVAVAIVALVLVWRHYEDDPWTRDGRVEADVVQVAADVSGLVTEVRVRDNQAVRTGEVLFVVDRERYTAQLAQADAHVADARASLANAQRERSRYMSLGDLVSREVRDQRTTAVETAAAQLQEAQANRRIAAINLRRSDVTARVDGYVTGFTMRPGDYVSQGKAVFALVDTDSYFVLGFFEETKLHRIHIGDAVRIDLLGESNRLSGRVVSLSAGITNRENSASPDLLPNITPTFSWIRLAQRIPVRVSIDPVPLGIHLIVGRTASVTVLPPSQYAHAPRPVLGPLPQAPVNANSAGAVPRPAANYQRDHP